MGFQRRRRRFIRSGMFGLNPIAALFAQGQQGVWYEPKPEYLFQDDGGTTPVTADGQVVGFIQDLSGNGNHATQSTTASKPIYRTDGTLHWLEFDGADDFTISPSVTTAGDGLLFADAWMVAAGTIKQSYGPLDTENSRNGYTLYNFNGSGDTRVFFGITANTFPQDPVGNKLVNSWRTDSINNLYSLRENGVVKDSGSIAASNQQINGAIYLGKTSLAGSEAPGLFYGRVIRGDSISDADIGNLENYLANLAGITL